MPRRHPLQLGSALRLAIAASALGVMGCAVALVPGPDGRTASRHDEAPTWASEKSSRWTISIQPDTESQGSAAATPAAELAVTSDPAENESAPLSSPASVPTPEVASVHGGEAVPAAAPVAAAPRELAAPDSLPTYVSPRSSLLSDEHRGPAAVASESAVEEAAGHSGPAPVNPAGDSPAPAVALVVPPPQVGGGEPADAADPALPEPLDPEYRIGVEDLLEVTMLGEPDLQHVALRVSPRGTIEFPYAGTLPAAGLSVEEFRRGMVERLNEYYVDPQLTVFLREYRSRMVHILGEVPRPGPFKLTHRNTLMEVLSRAGGFTPLADKSSVQVIRSDAAGKRVIQVNVNEIIDDGRIDLDIPLESGDVINVPERFF